MRQITSSTLSNQNLATALNVATYTADADRMLFVRCFVDQVAGNGSYSAYVTIQRLGAGSFYEVQPRTAPTVASGVTAIGFTTIPIPVKNTDVVKVYVLGLAGDTTTPDVITEIWEDETAITATTIAGYIDTEVAAIKAKTDNLPSDPASAGTISTSFSSISSTLTTIASYIDTEVAAIKAKTDNLPSDPADASDISAALAVISGYIDTEVATLITNVSSILGQTGTTGVALSTATKQAIADMVNSRGMVNIDGTADKYSIYHLIMSLLNGKQAAGSWIPYTTTGAQIPSMAVPVDTDPDALPVVGTHGA